MTVRELIKRLIEFPIEAPVVQGTALTEDDLRMSTDAHGNIQLVLHLKQASQGELGLKETKRS